MNAWFGKAARRTRSALSLLAYFLTPDRFFLLPLVVILLLAGVLFAASGGLSQVAPFVYTLF
jgi:hypothetical protein